MAATAQNMQTIFEDFFNIDLLAAPSTTSLGGVGSSSNNSNSTNSPINSSADASSSRSSSHSPSVFQYPLTPPQQDSNPVNVDDDSLFNLHINDEYLKYDPLTSYSSAPFDFFAGMDSLVGGVVSSGENTIASPISNSSASVTNSSTSATAAHSPSSYQYAIDPQLVGTLGPIPSTSTSPPMPMSTPSEVDDDEEGDKEDEEEDDLIIPPVKVGGKGKARKGTLQSGGIVKRTSAVRDPKDAKNDDPDDWRPSPEEYAKMSSKEKRQLRNKISARNFRVRRKEYISTLECDIAERDRLIDAIRNELGTTKSENHALRQEVAALKKAILEGRASPMLPPPAPLSPVSPLSTLVPTASTSTSNNTGASTSTSTTVSPSLITPNTRKDLPTSPRQANTAFWGGSNGGNGFGSFGGITPVHTALIPEFGVSPIVAKVAAAASSGDNINPAMNDSASNAQQSRQQPTMPYMTGFDMFQDNNMFTLKALDDYRMQLWGRMALQHQQLARQRGIHPHLYQQQQQQQHQQQQQQQTPSSSPSMSPRSPLQGLASNLRPHYFTSKVGSAHSSQGISALLSGKAFAASGSSHGGLGLGTGKGGYGLPTPPASPAQQHSSIASSSHTNNNSTNTNGPTPHHAVLAALASQTLLQKMSSAFWDAFSGSGSSSSSGGLKGIRGAAQTHAWDAEKVRKVLEGTAVVRIVDVDVPVTSSTNAGTSVASSSSSVTCLEDSMKLLSLSSTSSNSNSNSNDAVVSKVGGASTTAVAASAVAASVSTSVGAGAGGVQDDKSLEGGKCSSFFGKCSIRSTVVGGPALKK